MKKNLKNKKGFTLVELVVVIAILAILALILVPSITGYVNSANEAKDKANVKSLYSSAALIKATNPEYTTTQVEGAVETENNITGVTVSFSADGKTVTSVTYDGYTADSKTVVEASE